MRLSILYSAPLIDEQGHPISLLDFASEKQSLKESFDESGRAFEVFFGAATVDHLQEQVSQGCEILHYSGHGHPDFLAFEGKTGVAHALDVSMLKNLISAGGKPAIKLAFVSACHSRESGRAFADAGVKHIVAIRLTTPVYDIAAQVFARQFYHALLSGKTVKQAFDIGKARVSADNLIDSPDKEADKFLLLPEYGQHDVKLLEALPSGAWQDISPQATEFFRFYPADFTGRSNEMQSAMASVLNGRLTTLRGAPGIGKTALATALGHYLAERCYFCNGIFFVDLREKPSSDSVRSSIAQEMGIKAENDLDLFRQIGHLNILLILDNCEDPLHHDLKGFRSFVSQLATRCRHVRMLLTSRQVLGAGLQGITEAVKPIRHLQDKYARSLFCVKAHAAMNRNFYEDEVESDDFKAILKIMDGHPQAIALAAAQLDTKKLARLRRDLENAPAEMLTNMEIPEEDRDATTSFALSLGVSVGYVKERKPQAVKLFALMGLLPGGALAQDLDRIWGEESWCELMDTLVRYSLIERREMGEGEYFSAFPFVTAYAEKLLTEDDRTIFVKKILRYYGELSEFVYSNFFREEGKTAQFLFSLLEANFHACVHPKRIEKYPNPSDLQQPLEQISGNLPLVFLLTDRADDGIIFAKNTVPLLYNCQHNSGRSQHA